MRNVDAVKNSGVLTSVAATLNNLRIQLEALNIQGDIRVHHMVREEAVKMIYMQKTLEEAAFYEENFGNSNRKKQEEGKQDELRNVHGN